MLRDARPEDLPEILAIYAPFIRNTAYTFEYEVPSPAAFAARFRAITARYPWLVWEEDGSILGYAYGSEFQPRAAFQWGADLSIYLSPEAQGRGIGRALYTALEERMAALGYYILYAAVTSANEGSCRFHEALGYTEVARFPKTGVKFGRWYDIIWYEKRVREGIPSEPPLLPGKE